MSDEKDKKASEEGEERTVFLPSGSTPPVPPPPRPEPAPPLPGAEPAPPPTGAEPATPPDGTVAVPPPTGDATAPGGAPASLSTAAIEPRSGARPIKVGDVLNDIFEVKRFLARGGMGEVFEGRNVNSDERVAIKVMLPALAADEKVVAMFRKEARTLTRLHHECIVPYRVLAQEPDLGVLYIVTDYIDGKNLADIMGEINPSPEDLAVLLRRLADGLDAAHKMDLVHRDMSPDNVILPEGDIRQAKIIDFGIAKDLDASSATIIGDGFAGKLNYVAPEQLGDFGREVGPWTDVYSLALVILAVAQGRNVNMSGSLVDAIDKRRKGPDLSPAPDNLRPLLEAMLRPDPKERLRSMDEVLAMLGGTRVWPSPPPSAPSSAATTAAPATGGGAPKGLIVAGVLALAAAAGAGAWFALDGTNTLFPGGDDGGGNEISSNAIERAGDPVAAARTTINAMLPSVGCTWLDIGSIANSEGAVTVAMRGVAGDGQAALRELNATLAGAGLEGARIDFGDVAPINPAGCAALDTYRGVRASSASQLSVPQPRFEMMLQPPGLPYAGQTAANAIVEFDFGSSASDFAIAAIEPSGAITTLIPSRNDFRAALSQSINGRPISDLGNGRYRLHIDLDHDGWSGIMLISGQGPFVPDLIAPPVGSRGPSWQQQFREAARQGGWGVEMVWFESVNRVPDDSTSAVPATAAPSAEPVAADTGGKDP